jgi:L-lactate utilization protein LutC
MNYNTLASEETLEKTINALKANGINSIVTNNAQEAKEKVISMIPKKSEVMTMTSITLETVGLTQLLNESGNYNSVKVSLEKMDRDTDSLQMQKLGAAPEYAVGSVHAVTEDGIVVIASNTGSQLPAYAYGSQHVIWVVGIQKIVPNLDEAMNRIKQYIVPKESVRARKAYGLPETWHTNMSKILVVHKEVNPGRLTIIFVKEVLGF